MAQITVIGAGNMGSLYGANLARSGESVALLDPWREHVDAISHEGLQMSGLHGEFIARVHASTRVEDIPPTDIAIVFVNGYDTQAAADAAKHILRPSGFCITLQNGLGNLEVLNATLGQSRVLGGLSFHSADTQAPGQVRHTNQGPTYLGEQDRQKTARLDELAALMDRAAMEPVVEDDIVATIWGKFIHNCGLNALCAITNLRPAHISEVPALDAFQTAIIDEAVALARAKEVELPDPEPLQAIKRYGTEKFHRVSMQQHLDRGRRTEIDSLNGYVVTESAKFGLGTPANTALTALIKGRQHEPEKWPAQGKTVY